MTSPRQRWKDALDDARRRWQHASPAGRAAITAELDALADELDLAGFVVGPRHCSAPALLLAWRAA